MLHYFRKFFQENYIITEDIRQGCSIIKKHAEEIKVKFGSAVASENRDDEVVSIPGIRGREPKEISFKNLASIIQARLEEIFDLVNHEIQKVNSQHKLIAGIVLTGGGAMMKHIRQLAEFKTGLEVRLGYPNEYLSNETSEELASPMYSTGIGLVMEGIAKYEIDKKKGENPQSLNKGKRVEIPVQKEVKEDRAEEKDTESRFVLKNIITRFTGFFKQEDLDKDLN